MEEIWEDITGYEGFYQVSNLGRVKSLEKIIIRLSDNGNYSRKERVLKNKKNHKNYLIITLHKEKVRKNFMIHRLVAFSFVPNPDNKPQVNHIDGDKQNNYSKNLEWVTNQENITHSWENGLRTKGHFRGANNPKVKLSEKQVIEIRKRYTQENLTYKELGEEFGVCFSIVSRIVRRELWKHI